MPVTEAGVCLSLHCHRRRGERSRADGKEVRAWRITVDDQQASWRLVVCLGAVALAVVLLHVSNLNSSGADPACCIACELECTPGVSAMQDDGPKVLRGPRASCLKQYCTTQAGLALPFKFLWLQHTKHRMCTTPAWQLLFMRAPV